MRLLTLALLAALSAVVVGCLGSAPADKGAAADGSAPDSSPDAAVGAAAADLGSAPAADLTVPRPLPMDLGSTDLAGFVNCFNDTVCDPTTTFCIKYHSGSAAAPGTVVSGPACYQPADCMGTAMNCACITQDATLGGACLNCVDHMDGTYDCYAQP